MALEGGAGWLAAEAAQRFPAAEVLSLDRDFRNVKAAENSLANIPNAQAGSEVIPSTQDFNNFILFLN